MREFFEIAPTGVIDRRSPVDEGSAEDVRNRENFFVAGVKPDLYVKKCIGSDRYSNADTGTYYTGGIRYYSASIRKTFAYNNGALYHIAPNGAETALITNLNPTAYPSFETMKISGVNLCHFVNGFDGMYSYDGNEANFWKKEPTTLNFVKILSHLDRMFAFEENSEDLYFSKNLEPNNYTDSTDAGVITIGAKRGSKLQNIILLNETIYIIKEDSIWVLLGRTPYEFEVREVHSFLGTPARWSVCNVESAFMFLGSDYEVYSCGGTFESTKLMTYKVALSGEGGGFNQHINAIINKTKMVKVVAVFHNHFYRMAFAETGSNDNNLEYVYNTINQTEHFTRGNNVSCYIPYPKYEDQGELLTGRHDIGFLMQQYRGKNYDNQASGATMSVKLVTKFVKPQSIRNNRFKRAWLNSNDLGAEPVTARFYVDGRTNPTNSDTVELPIQGETSGGFTANIKIRAQDAVTSRGILPRAKAKGQSIQYQIEFTKSNIELSFKSIITEAIGKELKRTEKIGT